MKKITIAGSPISVNMLYTGRRFLTKLGNSVKKTYNYEFKSQWKGKMIECEVEVFIDVYFKNKQRRDIDGILKAMLDSMTGIVFRDDSQICRLTVERFYDRDNPRTEIEVTEVSKLKD